MANSFPNISLNVSQNQISSPSVIVCDFSSTFLIVRNILSVMAYNVAPPICIIFGLSSHILALITFLKPSKTEKAYSHQISVCAGKIAQIVCCTSFFILYYNVAGQNYTGDGSGGWNWFRASFPLMWYTSTISGVLNSAVTTIVALLTALMTMDRALALTKPILYKFTLKKAYQLPMIGLCWVLGLFFSLETGFRYIMVKNDQGLYSFMANPAYSGDQLLYANSQGRNGARAVALLAIVICSSIMIHAFRLRNRKVNNTNNNNQEKNEKNTAMEKIIFVIAVFQSFTVGVTSILPFIYNMSLFVAPKFGKCEGVLASIINDLLLQITNTMEFYVLFVINKRFRMSITNLMPIWIRSKLISVLEMTIDKKSGMVSSATGIASGTINVNVQSQLVC